MTQAPANAQFGTVKGRFIVGIEDGSDADLNPDYIPAQGEILFTPSVPYVPNPSAPGGPVTMLKTSIRAVLDAEGYLCTANPDGTPGARGLKLLATDDANMLVTGWTWNVGYYFDSVGMTPPKVETHGIAVPGGSSVDLTTTLKVPATQGYGVPQAEAAALRAEALLNDTAGIVAEQALERVGESGIVTEATLSDALADFDSFVGVPIFETLAEAEEWEAAHPGKVALTLEPSTPDTTPPTPGVLSVSEGATSAMLTVVGASDDRAVTGYAFSKDDGASWSAWQSGSSLTMGGLVPLTQYKFRHKVRDHAGNETVGVSVQKTTLDAPFTGAEDDFDNAPDGSIVGRVTQTGGLAWAEGTGGDYVASGAATGVPQVEGGKLVRGASILTLPSPHMRLEFDYVATGIIRVGIASDGTTPIMIQLAKSTGGQYKLYNGTTEVGPQVTAGWKDAGHAAITYDGTTVTLEVDGAQIFARDIPGKTGTRFGFAMGKDSSYGSIDNLVVTPL